MNYYEIAPLGLKLSNLTYASESPLEIGQFVNIKVRSKLTAGVICAKVEEPSFKCLQIESLLEQYLTKEQIEIAKFIAYYYVCESSEAISLFEPFCTDAYELARFDKKSTFELSIEQQKAFEFCSSRKLSLLFGDTGSGKTEIYIRLIEEALGRGQNAVLLLPEISLTPQIQNRLSLVFGDLIALWHSKQTKKTKEKVLEKIHSGEARVIIGPRSALFLPIRNLGIIIVDEEHDDSFKSETRPRYNARDMAIFIGKKLDINVILGSATPSAISYKNIPHFRLKGQFFESSKQFRFLAKEPKIDDELVNYLKSTLTKENSQAIIFLPTRANFKYAVCNNCYKSVECPYCSVSMSLHLNEKQLKCHYCGFSEFIPSTCPSCNDGLLGFYRIGTSEVLSELDARMGDKKFAKFDRDEITTEKKLKKTLQDFNDGKIDVLIGTQMLSKGHDYHNVGTAIILGIDSVLLQSDFRARERAMSLLVQISGRAGRKNSASVQVQTFNGEFFSKYIEDYEQFLIDEIKNRESLYPPHKRFARLIFSELSKQKSEQKMNEAVLVLKGAAIEIVGYGEAAIGKIGGKYRFDILLRSENAKDLLCAIYTLDTREFTTDLDPISFT